MSDGRDLILRSLGRPRTSPGAPLQFALPPWTSDLVSSFAARAKASAAHVHPVASIGDVPVHALDIVRRAGVPPELHIAPGSPLHQLPWRNAPELVISKAPPAGDKSALSAADYGIAETGTLVFCSGALPSSWHFLPGLEVVVIDKALIVARFEDVLTRIDADDIPATVNLVTGPSRTADIEQTIEMGAHGPRDVHILIVG